MKCEKCMSKKPIIKFTYEFISNKVFCLDCLVEWLDNIIENKEIHLIENIKKIIPIYNF